MTFQEWRPQTRRNKIALGIAVFSLLLMIGWNLGPMPNGEQNTIGSWLWSEVYDETRDSLRDYQSAHIPTVIVGFNLVLLVCLQFTMIPLWRLFSQSRLLRYIPAAICLIGFGICGYFSLRQLSYSLVKIYPVLLITLNFYVATIAVLSFKNEENDIELTHDSL